MYSKQIKFKHWIGNTKLLLNVLLNVLHDHFNGRVINNSNDAGVQIQSNVGASILNLPLTGL